MMYAWASPDYILDHMSFDQVLMYYEKGVKAIELQAKVFWGVLGQAMSSERTEDAPVEMSDKPDLQKFREKYGGKIIRG